MCTGEIDDKMGIVFCCSSALNNALAILPLLHCIKVYILVIVYPLNCDIPDLLILDAFAK